MRRIGGVRVTGVVTASPSRVEDNTIFSDDDLRKLVSNIGVKQRRVSQGELTSDLGIAAAQRLLNALSVDPSSIDAIVFVTQTPDYQIPSTSPLIAKKLQLRTGISTFDINQGCSGFVSGLELSASLISSGLKKVLLIAGDVTTRFLAPEDMAGRLLFGDGASASLLEATDRSDAGEIVFDSWVDGTGSQDIIIKNYGTSGRNPIVDSINRECFLSLNGANVFSFAISKVPKIVNEFIQSNEIDKTKVLFGFHQANRMINAMLEKKLALQDGQVVNSIENFGNTSSASIPLSLTNNKNKVLNYHSMCLVGFGVGLSISVCYFSYQNLYLEHIEYVNT